MSNEPRFNLSSGARYLGFLSEHGECVDAAFIQFSAQPSRATSHKKAGGDLIPTYANPSAKGPRDSVQVGAKSGKTTQFWLQPSQCRNPRWGARPLRSAFPWVQERRQAPRVGVRHGGYSYWGARCERILTKWACHVGPRPAGEDVEASCGGPPGPVKLGAEALV